jgi:hypothetical protein
MFRRRIDLAPSENKEAEVIIIIEIQKKKIILISKYMVCLK